jgi:hypothetical protein
MVVYEVCGQALALLVRAIMIAVRRKLLDASVSP